MFWEKNIFIREAGGGQHITSSSVAYIGLGYIVLARDPPIRLFVWVFAKFGRVWDDRQSLKYSLVDG